MMVREEHDTECKHVAEHARVLAFTPDDDFAVFRKALADTVEALPEGLAGLRHVVGNIIQRVVAATEHLPDFCLSLSPPPITSAPYRMKAAAPVVRVRPARSLLHTRL